MSSFSFIDILGSTTGCGILGDPTDGKVVQRGSTIGSIASYSCSSGFTLQGDSERFCTNTGHWSGVAPRCVSSGKH